MRAGNVQNVSTSATAIDDQGKAIYYVHGEEGTNRFLDVVLFDRNITAPIVLHSNTVQGSPQARTYTRDFNTLELAMAANTYDISYYGVVLPDPS